MKKLNLNERIKVKLTPYGAEIFYHQFDELNETLHKRSVKPIEPKMPQVDKDGFTEFQLWQFIEMYGEYIGMAKKNVITDMNFYIPDDKLEDVKTE